jgi:hypothetical protein
MTKPAVDEAMGISGTDTSNCRAYCEHEEDMSITRGLLHFLLIQLFLFRCKARVYCASLDNSPESIYTYAVADREAYVRLGINLY